MSTHDEMNRDKMVIDRRYMVIQVDAEDREVSSYPKLLAHEDGILHRAVSVFIIRPNGQWLVQRRAQLKYHSPGLWSNTSCTHPYPGENVFHAAIRCLREEMGIQCDLEKKFEFIYKADVGQGLIEHEYDHVFVGYSDQQPAPSSHEVSAWKDMTYDDLADEIATHPERFTEWFKLLHNKVYEELNKK